MDCPAAVVEARPNLTCPHCGAAMRIGGLCVRRETGTQGSGKIPFYVCHSCDKPVKGPTEPGESGASRSETKPQPE